MEPLHRVFPHAVRWPNDAVKGYVRELQQEVKDQGLWALFLDEELGGPGFTGEGWETKLSFPAIGSDQAVKGGRLVRDMPDWPATLRQRGKDWNSGPNYAINNLAMPALLRTHPHTLEYIPTLATHWWIAPDKMTYRFRINPAARLYGPPASLLFLIGFFSGSCTSATAEDFDLTGHGSKRTFRQNPVLSHCRKNWRLCAPISRQPMGHS